MMKSGMSNGRAESDVVTMSTPSSEMLEIICTCPLNYQFGQFYCFLAATETMLPGCSIACNINVENMKWVSPLVF